MKFLDFFSGVGGFTAGLENTGHECVGHCEFNKSAEASYRSMHTITEEQREYIVTLDEKKRQKEILKDEYLNGEWFNEDIQTVEANKMPKADCWTFGAPCQDFSSIGERRGLDGNRSVLIKEIFRLLDSTAEEDKPEWLIYENVEGMLYRNRGWDYFSILSEMDEHGYDAEWQIINTNSVICQSRPRVYTVGHLRARGTKQVFPIEKAYFKNDYGKEKVLIYPDKVEEDIVYLSENKTIANLFNFKSESKLSVPIFVELVAGNFLYCKMESNCLDTRCSKGVTNFGTCASGVILNGDNPREDSIRLKIDGEIHSIRRLTPLECWRLQGWSDDYYRKASQVTSDSQLYKQAGNGVTVRIIELLGEKLKELE